MLFSWATSNRFFPSSACTSFSFPSGSMYVIGTVLTDRTPPEINHARSEFSLSSIQLPESQRNIEEEASFLLVVEYDLLPIVHRLSSKLLLEPSTITVSNWRLVTLDLEVPNSLITGNRKVRCIMAILLCTTNRYSTLATRTSQRRRLCLLYPRGLK